MLFVLDVGNTNMVLGVFKENKLVHEWRIKTDRYKTEDEFGMLVGSLFDYQGLRFSDIEGIAISSVVPPIMFSLEKMCRKYIGVQPVVIESGSIKGLLEMTYPNPNEIGADRIVNAIGAIKEYGAPLVIIDFGTATTYCYVNEESAYEGGLISPGIQISMEALYNKASKLPKIEIEAPDNVVGTSTVEAMQSGVFYGYLAQVDGIVNRMKQEKNTAPKVIATGGLAELIGNGSDTIDYVDKYLTLKGLHFIYHATNGKKETGTS